MRRFIWPWVALALVVAYPLLFSSPFQQRLGALILLYAIAASAWNVIGGYAGQVSVGHVVFFGCGAYAATAAYSHFGRSEEHTSELQSHLNLVCRLLLEKKNTIINSHTRMS